MKLYKLPVLIGAILLLTIPYLMQAEEEGVSARKVVGGQPADPGEYPFMVALMSPGNSDGYNAHYCGGALIHPEWVLTAAHCLVGESSVDIGLGIHDLSQWQTEGERILVSEIIQHPNYNSPATDNDIALLKLSSPANGYQLATYATSEAQNTAGTNAIATGWGALSEGGTYPTILYEVDLPLISNSDCNAWGQNGDVTDNMLCAGYRAGEKDTCQGDSGGPLFYYDNGTPVLVGATSWGDGCARPDFPGVYARVSYFAEWIASYVGDPNITPTPTNTPDPNATATATPMPTMTPTPIPATGSDAYENDDESVDASVIADGEVQEHSLFPAGDLDWMTFTIDDLSAVSIETLGADGDTELYLFDSEGNDVDYNDDGGISLFSEIERVCGSNPLSAGTYLIAVVEYDDAELPLYNISLEATSCTDAPPPPEPDSYEGDDTAATASTITDGETQTHSILPTGDNDWLTFTLTEESAVNILTASDNSGENDTRLYLYDAAGSEVDFNDDIISTVDLYSQIERTCEANPLPAGTYTILVDEYANDDTIESYNISLDVTPCSGVAVTETPTSTSVPPTNVPTSTPEPTVPPTPETPLAVTFNGVETGATMSGWVLWGVALITQVGLVALVVHRRADIRQGR